MRRIFALLAMAVLVCAVLAGPAEAKREAKIVEKTFDGIESLRIDLVLGGCRIEQGRGNGVSVRLEYTYDDDEFEFDMQERGSTLYLEEDFEGDNVKGDSEWTITVPKGIDIQFESATGGLEVVGVTGEIEANSGTGSIVIADFDGEVDANSGTGHVSVTGSKGEFEVNSGTGRITIDDCTGDIDANSGTGSVVVMKAKGDFKVNSGTGNVEARNIELLESGDFNSGTGRAEIDLPKGGSYELEVSSGTGNAVVECGGRKIDAYVEMTAKKRNGRISSSFDFEGEEEFTRHDDEYVRKYFTSGSGSSKIKISTGTGTAKLKK